MFCTHCGNPLPDGFRFCPNCGSPVTARQQPVRPQPQYQGQPLRPKAPKKPGKKLFAYAGAGVAVIAIVVCLLLFLKGGGSTGEVYPLPAQGNSRPVKITPVPGITISAPGNAMAQNHEVSFEFADGGDWEKAKEVLKEEEIHPLCAFEFDAGLKSGDIIPGNFNFSIDLKELGIPPSLYDRVQIWRVPSDNKYDYYQYSTQVRGGKLSFKSNQNSLIVIALGTAFVTYGVMKLVHSIQEVYVRKYFFSKKDSYDCMSTEVEDPNGNFTLYFKFSDTERPNGAKAYIENEDAALKRLAELEKEADAAVERLVNQVVAGRDELGWWERWKLKKDRDDARKRINREDILNDLIAHDPLLTKLNNSPDAKLPEGVLRVIEMVKWSNRYLNQAHVKPLDINMEVYLVDQSVIGTDAGRCVKRVGGKPFLLINVNNLYNSDGRGGKRFAFTPKKGMGSLTTIAHELFHARQQTNYCPVHMGMYPAEATATVLEYDAARWFHKNGMMSFDVDGANGDDLEMSPRNHMEIFAHSLDEIVATDHYSILDISSPSRLWNKTAQSFSEAANVGYTMGYVIEALREVSKDKTRSMHYVVAQYPSHSSSFSDMVKYGLSMTDKEFDAGWNYFCDKHMQELYTIQYNLNITDAEQVLTECHSLPLTIGEGRPVEELKIDKKNFYFRTWKVDFQKGSGKDYNLLIAKKGGKISPTVNFYLTDSKRPMKNGGNKTSRFMEQPSGRPEIAAAVTSNKFNTRDEEYYAVCLFKPKKIEDLKVKKDYIQFRLPKYSKVLMKKGFLSGAEVTLALDKGKKFTRIVEVEDLGDKVKWEIDNIGNKKFKLIIKWFYKEDKETIFKSPGSDPVMYGAAEEEIIDVPADTVVTAGQAEVISMPQAEPEYFYDGDFVFTHIDPQWGTENLGGYFKEHRVVGHISASGGHYVLNIPAFSGKWNKVTFKFSAIVAEGEYKAGSYGGLWITGLQDICTPITIKWSRSEDNNKTLNVTNHYIPRSKEDVGFSALFELKRFDENKKTRFSIYIKANMTVESNWASYRIEKPERNDFWIHGYITIPGYEPILYH